MPQSGKIGLMTGNIQELWFILSRKTEEGPEALEEREREGGKRLGGKQGEREREKKRKCWMVRSGCHKKSTKRE